MAVAQLWIVRQHETLMKYTLLAIPLSLLLFGCNRHDAQLRKEVVGSWKGSSGLCAFDSDGTFTTPVPGHTNQLAKGTWLIKDGVIVITITKPAQSTKDRLKIVHVGDGQLSVVDEVNGNTYLLER